MGIRLPEVKEADLQQVWRDHGLRTVLTAFELFERKSYWKAKNPSVFLLTAHINNHSPELLHSSAGLSRNSGWEGNHGRQRFKFFREGWRWDVMRFELGLVVSYHTSTAINPAVFTNIGSPLLIIILNLSSYCCSLYRFHTFHIFFRNASDARVSLLIWFYGLPPAGDDS